MDQLLSQIMTILSRGPALTIDVSESIGRDTSQTSAILDYYAGKNDISRTNRKLGSSPVYFLEKDRDIALNRLFSTLNGKEKTLVDKIKAQRVVKSAELSPVERYISSSLDDFIKKAVVKDSESDQQFEIVFYYKLSGDEVKAIISNQAAPRTKSSVVPQATPVKMRVNRSAKSASSQQDIELLSRFNFKEPSRLDKAVYLAKYGEYNLNVVVLISYKSNLSKSEIVRAVGYATEHKTVSFIITTAKKVTGRISEGNLVNIIKVQ